MSFVMVILVICIGLFLLAFGSKRRFGVLGLSLAAGSMINHLWLGELTPLVSETGIELVAPPLESVVAASLILLPALLLLITGGPTYRGVKPRLLGAIAFSVLAITLLLEPLGSGLVIEGVGQTAYDLLSQYQVIIVTVGLGLALVDLMVTKTPKAAKSKSKD